MSIEKCSIRALVSDCLPVSLKCNLLSLLRCAFGCCKQMRFHACGCNGGRCVASQDSSTRLVQALERQESDTALLKQIQHEEKRLAITPQLGVGAAAEAKPDNPHQRGDDAGKRVARKEPGVNRTEQ
eukprot:6471974-Amphidinium_carterae.1